MEGTELNNLLRGESRHPTRGRRGCPADLRLAAYSEGGLIQAERAALESHLADCSQCRAQVAFLVKSTDWPEPDAVPARLLFSAKRLAAANKPAHSPRWGWLWAAPAFASLLLAVGLFVALRPDRSATEQGASVPMIAQTLPAHNPSPSVSPVAAAPPMPTPAAVAGSSRRPMPDDPRAKRASTPDPRVRRAEINGLSPALSFPRDGSMLSRGEVEFRWRPVPETVFYEVHVVTAAGDLTFSERTEETRLRLPPDVSLAPGAKYYVSVRAHLREAKTAKSNFVGFHVLD